MLPFTIHYYYCISFFSMLLRAHKLLQIALTFCIHEPTEQGRYSTLRQRQLPAPREIASATQKNPQFINLAQFLFRIQEYCQSSDVLCEVEGVAIPRRTIVRFPSLRVSFPDLPRISEWGADMSASSSGFKSSRFRGSFRALARCDRWRSAAPRKMQIAVDLLIFCGYKGATRLNKQIEVW